MNIKAILKNDAEELLSKELQEVKGGGSSTSACWSSCDSSCSSSCQQSCQNGKVSGTEKQQ